MQMSCVLCKSTDFSSVIVFMTTQQNDWTLFLFILYLFVWCSDHSIMTKVMAPHQILRTVVAELHYKRFPARFNHGLFCGCGCIRTFMWTCLDVCGWLESLVEEQNPEGTPEGTRHVCGAGGSDVEPVDEMKNPSADTPHKLEVKLVAAGQRWGMIMVVTLLKWPCSLLEHNDL